MLSGVYTAIVTPFNRDGSVDYARLTDLVLWQIDAGVAGLVPVGTTGESPTLNNAEHLKTIETVADLCRGKVATIAGTGSNATAEALELTRECMASGVDATLQVAPYYNKPSQEGLFRHFSAVADLGLPVVLYNVPGRSACEIAVETIARLAKHPRVVAVKEAGGSVDRVSRILNACDIVVLSGDDSLTLPMIAVGAKGVISVTSNVVPERMVEMVARALAGEWDGATRAHAELYPLMRDLFIETNPVPVKAALAMMGRIEETYRLPLCELAPANAAALRSTLIKTGTLKEPAR